MNQMKKTIMISLAVLLLSGCASDKNKESSRVTSKTPATTSGMQTTAAASDPQNNKNKAVAETKPSQVQQTTIRAASTPNQEPAKAPTASPSKSPAPAPVVVSNKIPAPTVITNGVLNKRPKGTGLEIFDKLKATGIFTSNPTIDCLMLGGQPGKPRLAYAADQDMVDGNVDMYNPTPAMVSYFKGICELILPGHGNELYDKVMNNRESELNFTMGGRKLETDYSGGLGVPYYVLQFYPYPAGTVMVNPNEIYNGSSFIPQITKLGFIKYETEGWYEYNEFNNPKLVQPYFQYLDYVINPTNCDVRFFYKASDPKRDKEKDEKYRAILKMLLPTQADNFYHAVDNFVGNFKTYHYDGRRIDLTNYDWGTEFDFGPIIK